MLRKESKKFYYMGTPAVMYGAQPQVYKVQSPCYCIRHGHIVREVWKVCGVAGFKDGPLSKSTLNCPFRLCSRGQSFFIAEHPKEFQDAIRVLSSLTGLVQIK